MASNIDLDAYSEISSGTHTPQTSNYEEEKSRYIPVEPRTMMIGDCSLELVIEQLQRALAGKQDSNAAILLPTDTAPCTAVTTLALILQTQKQITQKDGDQPPVREYLDGGYIESTTLRKNDDTREDNKEAFYFTKAFSAPPKIMFGLHLLSFAYDHYPRVYTWASNVMPSNFRLGTHSWNDSKMLAVGANWLAIGPEAEQAGFQTGRYHTPCSLEYPTSEMCQTWIEFPKEYDNEPVVVVWLQDLDLGGRARVYAYASNILTNGFTLSIGSSYGCRLYGASASWLAYPRGTPGVCSGTAHGSSGSVQFPQGKFEKRPSKWLFALNQFNFNKGHTPKLKTKIEWINKSGLSYRIEPGDSTQIWNCAGDWIALA